MAEDSTKELRDADSDWRRRGILSLKKLLEKKP